MTSSRNLDAAEPDVFLSHNGKDKLPVRELARALERHGLNVWLDEDRLIPGDNWQPLLEAATKASRTAAVLIGKDGLGPWEDEEMQVLLRLAVKNRRRVIPVLLPGAPAEPELPEFLENRTWVDLRPGLASEGFERLVWGITGKQPRTISPGKAAERDASGAAERLPSAKGSFVASLGERRPAPAGYRIEVIEPTRKQAKPAEGGALAEAADDGSGTAGGRGDGAGMGTDADEASKGASVNSAEVASTTMVDANLEGANLAGTALFRLGDATRCRIDAKTFKRSGWKRSEFGVLAAKRGQFSADVFEMGIAKEAGVEEGDRDGLDKYAPYPVADVEELEELTKDREWPPEDDNPETVGQRQARIDELVTRVKRTPRAGDVVVGAELVRIIGKGNYGTVWQARIQATGGPCAVKVFDSDRLGLGTHLYRFRRGVRAMVHLNKEDAGRPHTVVRLYDTEESALAYSMTYLEGGDLTKPANKGWSLERRLEVFRAICGAVQFAHLQGVLHRDIKPGNIVMHEGQPVLTDFDTADLLFAKTLSTQSVGTISYAAPEQLTKKAMRDPSGDVYSLGRLLYFLLLGNDPDPTFEKVPELADIAEGHPGLSRIIRRSTLKDPSQRYQSVDELLADLDNYLEPDEVGVQPETASPSVNSAIEAARATWAKAEKLAREKNFGGAISAGRAAKNAVSGVDHGLWGEWDDQINEWEAKYGSMEAAVLWWRRKLFGAVPVWFGIGVLSVVGGVGAVFLKPDVLKWVPATSSSSRPSGSAKPASTSSSSRQNGSAKLASSAEEEASIAELGLQLRDVTLHPTQRAHAALLLVRRGVNDLRLAKLDSANLVEVDFRRVDLSGADLQDANLRGANLERADLSGAHLNDAHLQDAKLSSANLRDADLTDAHLSGLDLTRAELCKTKFVKADLRDAKLFLADLKEAVLTEANLGGANLRGADLREASLVKANLGGANLRGADLRGADLTKCHRDARTLHDRYTRFPDGIEFETGFRETVPPWRQH